MANKPNNPTEENRGIAKQPVAKPQNQWALIIREFRKRKLAVLALFVILFLITTSIFAPFIANDRPITYSGHNVFLYKDSLRTLTVLIPRLADDSQPVTGENNNPVSRQEMVRLQFQLLQSMLTPEFSQQLNELKSRLDQVIQSSDDLSSRSTQLGEIRNQLRREFSYRKVTLLTQRYWPVFSSLTAIEIFFMVGNLLIILLPLWKMFIRKLTQNKTIGFRLACQFLIFSVLPLAAGLLWWVMVPERNDRSNYKKFAAINQSEENRFANVVMDSAIWPFIAYGLDEPDLEKFRSPPFWGTTIWRSKKAAPDSQADLKQSQGNRLLPAWHRLHWLGTDSIGRDFCTRIIWGGRISLAVGLVAVSIYVTIGIIVGSVAGYFGGKVDLVISRLIEIVIVFPSFFLILTIVALVEPSILTIMVVIGVTGWTGVARLIRGEFLRLGQQEFVLAGRALGYSSVRIIFRHVLPNALAPVLVSATFGIAGAILIESSLSFLGLGITIPKPSWGGLLAEGKDSDIANWLLFFPGIAIFITITAYNLVGEALRDAADPRLRGQ